MKINADKATAFVCLWLVPQTIALAILYFGKRLTAVSFGSACAPAQLGALVSLVIMQGASPLKRSEYLVASPMIACIHTFAIYVANRMFEVSLPMATLNPLFGFDIWNRPDVLLGSFAASAAGLALLCLRR